MKLKDLPTDQVVPGLQIRSTTDPNKIATIKEVKEDGTYPGAGPCILAEIEWNDDRGWPTLIHVKDCPCEIVNEDDPKELPVPDEMADVVEDCVPDVPCMVCGEIVKNGSHSAVLFEGGGNYGSRFDYPGPESWIPASDVETQGTSARFVISIHDKCLLEKYNRVVTFVAERPQRLRIFYKLGMKIGEEWKK